MNNLQESIDNVTEYRDIPKIIFGTKCCVNGEFGLIIKL